MLVKLNQGLKVIFIFLLMISAVSAFFIYDNIILLTSDSVNYLQKNCKKDGP